MNNEYSQAIPPFYILIGGTIMAVATVIAWLSGARVIKAKNESIKELIEKTTFLQNVTVFAVVSSCTLLGLAGIIKGELVGAILSGIVGYVLGSIKKR
jgi:hypothetical protein